MNLPVHASYCRFRSLPAVFRSLVWEMFFIIINGFPQKNLFLAAKVSQVGSIVVPFWGFISRIKKGASLEPMGLKQSDYPGLSSA